MRLRKLHLQHFRNYESLEVEFHPELNILTGNNGEGKTNIIEAVYCLGLTKSFRAQNDQEMVRKGNSDFLIIGEFNNELNVYHRVAIHYGERKKTITLDHKRISRHSQLIGLFPMVLFHPEDHKITGGSPSERRRFLDLLLSQSDRNYLVQLQQYQKVIKQRNRLLLRIAEGDASERELDGWDEEFCRLGYAITLSRIRLIREIEPRVEEFFRKISGRDDSLNLSYQSRSEICLDSADAYFQSVAAMRKEELSRMQTLVGPHRDDFAFLLNGNDVRKFASRGEQKSVLLAIKLAEYFYLKEKTQTYPILLFDDIYSELDEHRQENIVTHLFNAGQAFVTATSLRQKPAKPFFAFLIKNGSLEQL